MFAFKNTNDGLKKPGAQHFLTQVRAKKRYTADDLDFHPGFNGENAIVYGEKRHFAFMAKNGNQK